MSSDPAEQTNLSNNTAVATVQPAKTPIAAGDRGLELRSLDDMWRFAQYVVSSGLAPKSFNTDNPVAAVLVALQMGAELGLTPMASLQNIAVINGRPSVWGDAMLAVCRASGIFDEQVFDEHFEGQGDQLTAVCTVRRLPNGKPTTRTFSMQDAKEAKLLEKDGPWKQYRRRMLQMRARSWACRDAFSDTLRGFKCAEEQWDTIDIPAQAPAAQRLPPAKTLDSLADRLEPARQEEPAAAPEPAPAAKKPAKRPPAPEPAPEPQAAAEPPAPAAERVEAEPPPPELYESLKAAIDGLAEVARSVPLMNMIEQGGETGELTVMGVKALKDRLEAKLKTLRGGGRRR